MQYESRREVALKLSERATMDDAEREKRIQAVGDRLLSTNSTISYGRQSISDDDIEAVAKVLRSPFLTTGPVAHEFEKELCDLTGAKHAIVCSSGTAALHLACLALNITEGDLGITSPITFLASANCVEFCGGRVDFVDIDPTTLCLSAEKLEAYCRDVAIPKVVIPVDFAGIPADLPVIHTLSKKYGFKVIEDAAHSIGSWYEWEGRQVSCGACVHSDAAIFSFHPVKTITCGEGGAILTNDDTLAERVRRMRSHGVQHNANLLTRNDGPWYYEMSDLNYNCRITDFQCALGKSQLKRLEYFKQRRQSIVDRYNLAFESYENLILPPAPDSSSVCYHLYPLQFLNGREQRFKVFQKLASMNIFCQIHYIPVYWQPYYKNKYKYPMGKCENAEAYYSRCLSLPLYPALTDDEVDFIIDSVVGCLE
jgi:UDP-4-amino-4,6-dideoxy-N-acetyl-beta-L-altrosamine transaminase